MADSTFVDVFYHGLDIGSRLRLCEFGPTTAYLEHPTPLPVGTPVRLSTDDGVSITATVLRVQEQVSGADHSPGMRVRAELDADAKGWWEQHITCEDPVIPELDVAPSPVPAADESDDDDPTEVAATRPVDVDQPAEPEPEGDTKRKKTVVMDPEEQEQLRAKTETKERRSTVVMSAAELSEITKHADEDPGSDTNPGTGTGNGKPKGKKKRRRRKKKPT